MSGIAKAAAPLVSFIPGWGPVAAAGLGLLGSMGGGASGPSQDANTVGGYYQSALNQVPQITADEINTEKAGLQPLFNQQTQGLAAKEAAMGITGSGAAHADFSDLGGQQAAALSQAIAPLYSQRLGIQGNILGQMPGAQSGAYQQGNQDYYNAMQGYGGLLGSLLKPGGQASGGNPYSVPQVPSSSSDSAYSDTAPDPYIASAGSGI